MNQQLQSLLEPVSADQPCGPDLTYTLLEEIETILKGKPEVEIGTMKKAAEPPDWGELRGKSVEFLKQSKHLRVGVIFCCSLLKTEGLPGFRDGLQLMQGLLEKYWPSIYPLLDADDNNDPTQRLNILASLTPKRGSVFGGSWLTIVDYIYSAAICRPKGGAPISLDQLVEARQPGSGSEGGTPTGPSLDGLGAALRASSDQVTASHEAAQQALAAVQSIDQFLTTTLSATKTISFEELTKTLKELEKTIQPYVPGAELDKSSSDAESAEGSAETPGGGISVSGPIRSRDDVVRALDRICGYYQQVEPGSPVPYLLRRAQKLAKMDFVQAVQELNLIADLSALKPSMGTVIDGVQPPPSS